MTALFFSSNDNANGKEKGPKSYNGPSTPFRLIPGLENAGGGERGGAVYGATSAIGMADSKTAMLEARPCVLSRGNGLCIGKTLSL